MEPNLEPASAEQQPTSPPGGTHRVLHAFREQRRRRRADDTYFGSSQVLLTGAELGLDSVQLERRRVDILEDAEQAGMPAELAELMYDVAREEGIDPALGLELVRSGLGVAPPDGGVATAPAAPATDKYLPGWMFGAIPPDRLLRERMLRVSFRRLRGLLEQHEALDAAFDAFAEEPDVGYYGY